MFTLLIESNYVDQQLNCTQCQEKIHIYDKGGEFSIRIKDMDKLSSHI